MSTLISSLTTLGSRSLSGAILALPLLAFALFLPVAAQASDLVRVESAHPVAETADRLVGAIEKAGLTLFSRIDHKAGAEKAGLSMAAAEVILFGNPKMGTVLMNQNLEIGLDLPLKVLIREADGGNSTLVYTSPAALKARYGVEGADKVFDRMTGALGKLTAAAAAP